MFLRTPVDEFANSIRVAVVTYYKYAFMPISVIGLFAFLALTIVRPFRAVRNVGYVLAAALGVSALCRLARSAPMAQVSW